MKTAPSKRSLLALDAINFLMTDLHTAVGRSSQFISPPSGRGRKKVKAKSEVDTHSEEGAINTSPVASQNPADAPW